MPLKAATYLVLFFYSIAAHAAQLCPSLPPGKSAAIRSSAEAVAVAKHAMAKRFKNEQVAEFEPYKASCESNVWHVCGYLPPMTVGGTPEADVCGTTGEVLRVYHTQ